MTNPVANLVNNVKAHLPGANKAQQPMEMSFLGHVDKPKGGCEGCKSCGCCGKKEGEGKKVDIRV